ncbi:MAG TPA: sulfite exporter TauE/SafE family protein [Amnibacterium sp.]|uniref:sulfite exporter TauE/SafE family protein n=1 Tax=Amnibacterium sp. TaxID=1872496 RepID=UPI002F92D1EF
MTQSDHPPHRPRWPLLAVIGIVGGLLSGLFGIGGGIVMVPLLTGIGKLDQRSAAATSLAAIVPTAIVGAGTYLAAGQADLLAALLISVGAIPGALLGSAMLKRLPVALLRWMFIVFMLLVAARLFLVPASRGGEVPFDPAIGAGYVLLGLVMGVLSGLLGIGGGVIAVPALVGVFGVSDLVAKGTSLLVMIPTSLVGTVANWRARTVRVGDGLVVGAAATVASLPGAAMALALPARLSTTLFAALLVLVAAQLTWKAIAAHRDSPAGTPRSSAG